MTVPLTKYALTIDDRIALTYSTFPAQGDILYVRAVKGISSAVELSEEEITECGLETFPDGRLHWTDKAKESREFDFKPSWIRVTKERLEAMNEKKELTTAFLHLYSLFVMPDDAEEDDADDTEPAAEPQES